MITLCQRVSASVEAESMYVTMIDKGFKPDVFTFTALIDTIARDGDIPGHLLVHSSL